MDQKNKKSEKCFLSVIVPAYNEEKRIGATLLSLDKYLNEKDYYYEIIVVIDGAKDKTERVVKKYDKVIDNLKIISNEKNNGKGFVVRQGLLLAKGDLRIFMDADNSTTIDQIENFLPYFKEGYSVIIGSRDLKESKIEKRQARWKEFLGDMGNYLIQLVGDLPGILDTQCGFKLFSAEAVKKICPKMKINRWGFDIEMLFLARKMNFKIKEVPVVWKNDEGSKVSFWAYFSTLIELFQVRWNWIREKYKE